jgi:sec-independent protein translocase protein TatA
MVGDILQPTHLLFILVVALLVLGPKRLPEVGRTLGNGLRDFRAAINGESDDREEAGPRYEVPRATYQPPTPAEEHSFAGATEPSADGHQLAGHESSTPSEHLFAGEGSAPPAEGHELAGQTSPAPAGGHEFAHEADLPAGERPQPLG